MELRTKLLKRLEGARGTFFSGEQLAEECGVSRNAVWKGIKSLRREGYEIASVRNRGYKLLAESDVLSPQSIEKFLEEPFAVYTTKITTSTNDDVRELAERGASEWTVVVAEEQTAGRGRYHRAFDSPADVGLYMSILLRPRFPAEETLFITACTAVAVCEAVEAVAQKYAEIKWVNDVFLNGKKICGILTEASYSVESGGLAYAVVGIGVNVKQRQFPQELAKVAGCVFEEGEYPSEGRAKLVGEILNRLRRYYEQIRVRTFYAEYKRRSFVLGKKVRVISGVFDDVADALDLDENCFLIVRFSDGSVRKLSAGEVRILPLNV